MTFKENKKPKGKARGNANTNLVWWVFCVWEKL
jgi:hypothetical protein